MIKSRERTNELMNTVTAVKDEIKNVANNVMHNEVENEKYDETRYYTRQITEGICYLFLIFLTGCLIGWFYEEIFYWFTEGMLRNRGILYGPWLPIYGVGALGIYAMKPLKKNPVLLFFLCAVVTGVVEYIIGYIGICYLHMRLWDYHGLFLNIDGIICFRSVVSFALMGVVFHYFLEPVTERMVRKANQNVIRAICLALLVMFLIDCLFSALYRTPITY